MIFFVDDIADHLELYNASVVILEQDQGFLDIIRWIEAGRFDLARFDVVGLLIGCAELKRSKNWFAACVEELLAVITKVNSSCLVLLGAILPSTVDSRWMVWEFIARNAILQNRVTAGRDRRKLEYARPGRSLLTTGGPVASYFDEDRRLAKLGLQVLTKALLEKFQSADLVKRALNLRSPGGDRGLPAVSAMV